MKRAVLLIIILALAIAAGCLYYFDLFSNIAFFSDIYLKLTDFGVKLRDKFDFLSRFDAKIVFVLFYSACAIAFLIVYLIICEFISLGSKKKKKKKKKNISNDPNSLAFPIAFLQEPNSQYTVPQSVPSTQTYKATDAIMCDEEKDIEFNWRNFLDAKKIVRKIIVGLLVIVLLLVLALRFFWAIRDAAGSCGIGFIDNIYKVGVINTIMVKVDDFFVNALSNFTPDPLNPDKNVILKNIMNGQSIYTSDLIEWLCIVVAFIIIIFIYLKITKWLVNLFKPMAAKRRAKDARKEYEEAVRKNKTPRYKPRHVKSTYIFNYFMAPVGYTTYAANRPMVNGQGGVPQAFGKDPVGQYEPGYYENIAGNASKAELLMGGSNFVGGNISSIAILDPLTEEYSAEENIKHIDYVEDISEGVKDYLVEDEEKPIEEYEDLAGTSSSAKVSAIADVDSVANEESQEEKVDVDTAHLASIFEINKELEDGEEKEVSESIAFDEDGFAYKMESEEEVVEEEPIPEPVEVEIPCDASTLIEDYTSVSTIREPDFELLDKVSMIRPIINLSNQKPKEEITSVADESSYVEDDEKLSEDQRSILAKYTPTLTPVEDFPDENLFVDDGSIKHLDEKSALPEGIKPLHEIKNRETPKIVPLQIIKEEVVEEEEVAPTPVPLTGPLHAINDASRKKDIKPVEINKDYRFALKRFQTTTYRGNLTPEEAFNLGVTKVAPVVNPVTNDVAKDSSIPSWMKRVKERNAKQSGVTESKLKQAEEISSIWEVNSKKDVVEKVNEVTLRRRRKIEPVEPIEEQEEEKDDIKISRPIAPIQVQVPVEEKEEEPKEAELPKIVKPIVPIHRPTDRKDIQPIKPITPIRPKKK